MSSVQKVQYGDLNIMNKTENQQTQLEKIVVSTGIGRLSGQPNFADKILPSIVSEFSSITGQKPKLRSAINSISGFKLREGTVVGLQATLRRKRMIQFLNKVTKVVLPRVRDFRGISPKSIDQRGNLSFGIKDHLVFPEIAPENSKTNFGVEITVVPKNLKSREAAAEFYKQLGIPMQKAAQKHG
ncbi:MAG: 50S ribosomal protein L5 [Candidatus Harrisonbacteria bacterium RIFCSPHIGHO2_12_FULL_48_16]|uniref:50S ribosomal protein L5 n=1 Tax=Candidatus Harrisonbacteria bacterium RIFCSPHIGHO2_12_FULL_48_16 TaxID=1798405 RepID=A0A1G1ZLQ6_9BACT|nr:MAG: 50S ribosomal protein L5 [Candidatus Harrisonbacteria bacterium RIFCSPHIGHO2_12_FULL_48_16]